MSTAGPLLRLAILPVLLLASAAQEPVLLVNLQEIAQPPPGAMQAATHVAVPQSCPERISEALKRERIPDFRNCTFDVAAQYGGYLKLIRNDAPDQNAAPGIVFNQEPAAGSPVPGDRTVTLFVSSGPPPPPRIVDVEIGDQIVDAGKQLEFAIAIKPADAVGKLSFSVTGGTAQPGRDYDANQAKGDLDVAPGGTPLVIAIDTRADPAASGDLTLNLLVEADSGATERAIGTIHEPPPLPCATGRESSCPPCISGTELSCPPCKYGDELSCPHRTWWQKLIDDVADLPPWVWFIPGVGIVAMLVRRFRPVSLPASETPPPGKGPSPPPATPPFDLVTTYTDGAAPPTVTSSGFGPKTPIVSLVVETTRGVPRIVSATQSMEDKDG